MEVGKHCSEETCKRLDFLPFTCSLCKLIFCKDHCSPEQHRCNEVRAGHSPSENKSSDKCVGEVGVAKASHAYQCSAKGCSRREKIEVICQHCCSTFCLSHRHPEDHSCSSLPSPPPPPPSSNPPQHPSKLAHRLAKPKVGGARGGAKSESLAAKVALMRLKQKSDGLQSIPQSERVYYDVSLPAGSKVQSASLFFSKEWSVGKVVDSISRKFNINNYNDIASPTQKLILYGNDGTTLNSSRSLRDCLDLAPSGSALRLDYEYS